MYNYFLILLLTILSCFIIVKNFYLKNKIIELSFLYVQSIIDNQIITDKILNNKDTTEKDHFISFLSNTRDDAFKYIENIQRDLIEFSNVIEKEKNNYSNESFNNILLAYKKLESNLPEEIPND